MARIVRRAWIGIVALLVVVLVARFAGREETLPPAPADPFLVALERARARQARGIEAAAAVGPGVSIRETLTREGPIQVRRLDSIGPGGRAGAAREMAAGEVLVCTTGDRADEEVRGWLASQGLSVIRRAPGSDLWRVRLPAGASVEGTIARLDGEDGVAWIEPNDVVRAFATPNDPRYPSLWGMKRIQAEPAWDRFKGSRTTVVGVIDTGVDYTHPDLAANVWTNPGEVPGNGKDDDGNGYADDVHGIDAVNNDRDPMDDHLHGTHVAGTIGAVGDNGVGVAGANWRVSVMALKFLSQYGSGVVSDAVECLDYARKNGAAITSNSWGGGAYSKSMKAAIDRANAAGVLFVAAAGNSASDNDAAPAYPASYDVANVIAVAATDPGDSLVYFSNYGKTSVDLGAPGVDVWSTTPVVPTQAMAILEIPAGYAPLAGTSMATPHVAGACALLEGLVPGLSAAEVKARLLATADPVPALAGRCVTGGRLNLARLVDLGSGPALAVIAAWVEDADGNRDGLLGPGETVDLAASVRNAGGSAARAVAASLALDAPDASVTLVRAAVPAGDLAAGAETTLPQSFRISLAAGASTPRRIALRITLRDAAGGSWSAAVPITAYQSSRIAGRVTLDGAPLPDAWVRFVGRPSGAVAAAADGTYRLGQAAGSATLWAEREGFLSSANVALAVPPGREGLDFAFRTATVSGRVTDLKTGDPIPGAIVSYAGPLSGEATTGTDGRYSIRHVYGRPATLSLAARKPGAYFDSEARSVTVPGDAPGIDFRLGRPVLAVSPPSISAAAPTGGSAAAAVAIANPGSLPLSWRIVKQMDAGVAPGAAPPGRVARYFRLPGGIANPEGIAWDGASIWITDWRGNGFNQIVQIDPASRAIRKTIGPRRDGDAFDMCWDGRYLWLCLSIRNQLKAIDPVTGDVVRTIPTPSDPRAVEFAEGSFWVGCPGSARIFRLAPADGRVLGSIPIPEAIWGFRVTNLAYSNGSFWTMARNDRLYKFRAADGTLAGSYESPSLDIQGIAADGEGSLWMASANPKKAFLVSSGDGNWMAASPLSGTLAPGGSASVAVSLDGAKAGDGRHAATLYVAANDPVSPSARVPVSFRVGPVNGPPSVSAYASPASGEAPLAVAFSAPASDPEGDPISFSWSFGDGATASVQNPSHTYASPGAYTATVTATDSEGNAAFASVSIQVAAPTSRTIQLRMAAGTDDATETVSSGSVSVSAGYDWLGADRTSGLRYPGAAIPPGSAILSARLFFWPGRDGNASISIRYRAEAADSAAPYAGSARELSLRPKTGASVSETPAAWAGSAFNPSADLSSIVGEVVNRPGWASGNALALHVENAASASRRGATSYNGNASRAPYLEIKFRPPAP